MDDIKWSTPEESNLERLKMIQQELASIIESIEQHENNNEFVNNELFAQSNYKHKTRTTKQINISEDCLQ